MNSEEKMKIRKIPNKECYGFLAENGDETIIGDLTSPIFKPSFLMSRWSWGCSLALLIPDSPSNVVLSEEENMLTWDGDMFSVKAYPVKKKIIAPSFIQNELGGLELELIIKKKPKADVFSLPFRSDNLVAYYQPPLTPEEIAEGCNQPSNVEGSYAFYHKNPSPRHKTGKAFHVYRPKLTDAMGIEAWCNLNLASDFLNIELPKDFMKNATYPITLDPNFGLETVGANNVTTTSDEIRGSWFTPTYSGTRQRSGRGLSMTCYIGGTNNAVPREFALYGNVWYIRETVDAQSFAANAWSPPLPFEGTPSIGRWQTGVGYVYWLCVWGESVDYNYDAGGAGTGFFQSLAYPGTWPATLTPTYQSRIYSIYCTYTKSTHATLGRQGKARPSIRAFNRLRAYS